MAYLTIALMRQYFDSRILVKLTDDTGILDPNTPTNADDNIVNLYIDDACYTVANFLRHTYDDVEPSSTPTAEIKMLAARLTWCGLWTRRAQEPTQVTELREATMKTLHKMAVVTSDRKRDNTNKSKVSVANRQ